MLCKKRNISITSLIENCNLSKGFIYEMEKRNKTPSVDKIEAIANYLDCSVDYLLGRTNNPNIQVSSSDFSGSTITNSTVGTNSANITVHNNLSKYEPSAQATELLRVFESLNVRDQTKLLSIAFELESQNLK